MGKWMLTRIQRKRCIYYLRYFHMKYLGMINANLHLKLILLPRLRMFTLTLRWQPVILTSRMTDSCWFITRSAVLTFTTRFPTVFSIVAIATNYKRIDTAFMFFHTLMIYSVIRISLAYNVIIYSFSTLSKLHVNSFICLSPHLRWNIMYKEQAFISLGGFALYIGVKVKNSFYRVFLFTK
jgi:hypothetical protein